MSALTDLIAKLDASAKELDVAGDHQSARVLYRASDSLAAALDADVAELRRLRDEARQLEEDCRVCQYPTTELQASARATAYETAARVMGRPLPEWRPKEGGK